MKIMRLDFLAICIKTPNTFVFAYYCTCQSNNFSQDDYS